MRAGSPRAHRWFAYHDSPEHGADKLTRAESRTDRIEEYHRARTEGYCCALFLSVPCVVATLDRANRFSKPGCWIPDRGNHRWWFGAKGGQPAETETHSSQQVGGGTSMESGVCVRGPGGLTKAAGVRSFRTSFA